MDQVQNEASKKANIAKAVNAAAVETLNSLDLRTVMDRPLDLIENDDLRNYVEERARDNHAPYAEQYPDVEDFVDAFAANWLARRETFTKSVEQAGMSRLEPVCNDIFSTNEVDVKKVQAEMKRLGTSRILALTSSGSIVEFGPGATTSQGGSFDYTTVPLRAADGLTDIKIAGEVMTTLPTVDKAVFPSTNNLSLKRQLIARTSPLLAVYAQPDTGAEAGVLSGALTDAFSNIASQTMPRLLTG